MNSSDSFLVKRVSSLASRFEKAARAIDPVNTVLKLSLIYNVFLMPRAKGFGLVFLLFAFIGITFEKILRSPILWGLILLIHGYNLAVAPTAFTGRFLNFYWTLAILIALVMGKTRAIMAINARFLVGLAFLHAFLWKAINIDFITGNFMRFSLQFCSVFRKPMNKMGLIDSDLHSSNTELWNSIMLANGEVAPAAVNEPVVITAIALFMTFWILIVEGITGIAFLAPANWKISKLRHPFLLLFMWSVYLIIPVWVFAGLFSAMGLCLTKRREAFWRVAYVFTFFAMTVLEYAIDIPGLVEKLSRRLL